MFLVSLEIDLVVVVFIVAITVERLWPGWYATSAGLEGWLGWSSRRSTASVLAIEDNSRIAICPWIDVCNV